MTSVQLAKKEIINRLDHLKLDLIWWDSGNWMMCKTDQAIGRSKKVGLSLMIILLGNSFIYFGELKWYKCHRLF